MPGPVIDAHKKYEQDCDQCHDTSDKQKQGKLCVQCHDHEDILDDLTKKTGFHGRLPKPSQNDCKHCHTEHEGRDANIVLLSPSTFNHQQTDFELKGTHKKKHHVTHAIKKIKNILKHRATATAVIKNRTHMMANKVKSAATAINQRAGVTQALITIKPTLH